MRISTTTLALVGCFAVAPAFAQSPDVGKGLFDQYCSGCHGVTAVGDGPVAEYLTVPPADLTGLAAANDGQFPMRNNFV